MPITFWTFIIGTAALMGVPALSGFWSKEAILGAALNENKILFASSVLTATLTAYYMTRVVVVAFLGKSRGEGASHAHEAPMIMTVPLLLLAFLSLFSGYGFFAGPLQAMLPHPHESGAVIVGVCSLAAVIIGFLAGTKLYRGKDTDPVSIPLFANKFYIDEIYAVIVKYAQDRFAWIVNALEKVFVDGLLVRLPAALTSGLGGVFRRLQGGELQGYTFLLGLGIVIAIYLAVFLGAKS
jgi:NADH-quinone oxidoreductase subunit L